MSYSILNNKINNNKNDIDDIFVISTIERINSFEIIQIDFLKKCQSYADLLNFVSRNSKIWNYKSFNPNDTYSSSYEIKSNSFEILSFVKIDDFVSMTKTQNILNFHNYPAILQKHLIENEIYPINYKHRNSSIDKIFLSFFQNKFNNGCNNKIDKYKIFCLNIYFNDKIRKKFIHHLTLKISLIQNFITKNNLHSNIIYLINIKLLKFYLEI